MKVIATIAGYVGKTPIQVERQGLSVNAVYILPGDVFEWPSDVASWMKPIDPVNPSEDPVNPSEDPAKNVGLPGNDSLTKNDVMTRLREAGIKFSNAASLETLIALLPAE